MLNIYVLWALEFFVSHFAGHYMVQISMFIPVFPGIWKISHESFTEFIWLTAWEGLGKGEGINDPKHNFWMDLKILGRGLEG